MTDDDDDEPTWAERLGLVPEKNRPPWADDFGFQTAELDFVVLENRRLPVGMSRRTPPEFRRRVLAGALSYFMQLKSVDYTLKRYVDDDQYDTEKLGLGDEVSDELAGCARRVMEELKNLHTPHPSFGEFGAEITLYRIPHALEAARLLSNRGSLLEVLPILRLVVEMTAWALSAFPIQDESKVIGLKASNCISGLKDVYPTAGRIYGYLSTFSHWGHAVHGHFLTFERKKTGVVFAAVRYRAQALALCAVTWDVFTAVVRHLYPDRCQQLLTAVQGSVEFDSSRKSYELVAKIADLTQLDELREVQSLLA